MLRKIYLICGEIVFTFNLLSRYEYNYYTLFKDKIIKTERYEYNIQTAWHSYRGVVASFIFCIINNSLSDISYTYMFEQDFEGYST